MITVAFVVLLALQVADYLTTVKGLEAGAKEKFMISRKLVDKFGIRTGVAIAKLIGVAGASAVGLAALHGDTISITLLYAVTIFYVGVVANNIKVLKKL